MKKWIMWSFDRGSFQYDVLCFLILLAMILLPSRLFNDRPDYMRLSDPGEIRTVLDDDGNRVYTVQLDRSTWFAGSEAEQEARERLIRYLVSEEVLEVYRTERIYDNWSAIAAYGFWLR